MAREKAAANPVLEMACMAESAPEMGGLKMGKRDLITKDFALYVVHYFASMLTWSKEDILGEIDRTIKDAKPEEAARVVHGRWIIDKEHLRATCSKCGKILRFSDEMQIAFLRDEERFCYFCGAKMDGGENNGEEQAQV